MDLTEHYNNLYNESSKKILGGNYIIDNQINSSSDDRFGITLLFRPDDQIKNNIQVFLNELKKADPSQYYYPNSDIHITVISIISCYNGFDLAKISIPEYVEIIEKSLVNIKGIEIHFQGVTASDSAVMIQGFPFDNSLNDLRINLKNNFKNSGLEESIDRRYSIFTAHSTVARFREKINDTGKFVKILEEFRHYDFGKFKVENLELVYNDWYQREKFVIPLHNFSLK